MISISSSTLSSVYFIIAEMLELMRLVFSDYIIKVFSNRSNIEIYYNKDSAVDKRSTKD